MKIVNFFRHSRFLLRTEIAIVIIVKLCLLMVIWYVSFSNPVQHGKRQAGLTELFFAGNAITKK